MDHVLMSRFWTEVYQGAKIFYMSGVINGKYLKNDVRNLTLYISRIKYRPLVWRNTHPYVVVDRFEDLTRAEVIRQDPKVGRIEEEEGGGCRSRRNDGKSSSLGIST